MFLPILQRFYFYGKCKRNFEDKNFFLLGIALIDREAIPGGRINSERKKFRFFEKFLGKS